MDPETAKKLREIEEIRRIEKNPIEITIIGVHLTGVEVDDINKLIDNFDLVPACGSQTIRERVRYSLKAGKYIPMYAISDRGKELLLERAKKVKKRIEMYTVEEMYTVDDELFCWDRIPGEDTERLIEFLKKEYNIDSIKRERIEKYDGEKAIRAQSEDVSVSIRLNDEKTKATLIIDDGRKYEFTTKMENGKRKIYAADKDQSK